MANIKIVDYVIFFKARTKYSNIDVETECRGYSLDTLRRMCPSDTYYNVMDRLYIDIYCECTNYFYDNFSRLLKYFEDMNDYLKNKKKDLHEFKWEEIPDYTINHENKYDWFVPNYKPTYTRKITLTLSTVLILLEYRAEFYNQSKELDIFLEFLDKEPYIRTFRRNVELDTLYFETVRKMFKEDGIIDD